MMKKTTLFLLFLSFLPGFRIYSQCAHPVNVNDSTINTISNVFQLTFLHEIPKNHVDSMVLVLNDPNIKHIIQEELIIQSIGATRSKEAFLLLYTCCTGPNVYEDLTLFGWFCSKIQSNGGFKVLNQFFLDNAVSEALPPELFSREVLKRCRQKKPKVFFCPERNRELTVEELQQTIDNTFSEYVTCENPVRITPENIYKIHNPYELTFLHKIPQNSTDSLVDKLLNYQFSSAAEAGTLLERVAASRSLEAYYFFYMCCAVDKKKNIGSNLFHNISNQVGIWGGFRLMNTYFLNGAVAETTDEIRFRQNVISYCEKLHPEIYFCHQPTIQELYEDSMQFIDPGKYDRQIIRIIHKHMNLKKNMNRGMEICEEVLQLPFVTDVLWDGCYDKLLIYPAYYSLVVKMSIDDKIVERYYSIKGSKFRYVGIRLGNKMALGRWVEVRKNQLDFTGCGYSPGYIKAAREYCIKKKEEEENYGDD